MNFQISVRRLVEFIFRHGDIDNLKKASPEEAMLEGARIHRMIQKQYEATLNYESEVALKYCYNTGRYDIYVEGRADGILHADVYSEVGEAVSEMAYDDANAIVSNVIKNEIDAKPTNPANTLLSEKLYFDYTNEIASFELSDQKNAVRGQVFSQVVIDEIKGTYKKIDYIERPEIEHLAQAKCYAYIYARENNLDSIGVRITYCGIESGDIKFFNAVYSYEEIENWFISLMVEYSRWTDYEYDWSMVRKLSIDRIEFPFEYREGQKKLVSAVYRTIEARKKLYIQAPTGSGKTIAAVFPTIKAIGNDMADKLFYLTAKTITRTVAEDTFGLLRNKGLAFKTVTLTAKEKICPLDQCECNPKSCPYAKGHMDRINEALYDVISNEQFFTRETIEFYANKHMVCAFELSLDISLFADGVICDYNYAFDPHVYLRRYFAEGNNGRYVFLVDEAHNLLDRSREMYSADLCREEMLELRKAIGSVDPKLATSLVTCARQMNKLKKTCDIYKLISDYPEVSKALGKVVSRIEAFLERDDSGNFSFDFSKNDLNEADEGENFFDNEIIDQESDIENLPSKENAMTAKVNNNIRKQVLDFYFKAIHFQYVEGIRNENYRCYCEKREDGTFIIRQLCIDPSDNLRDVMMRAESVVLFSATLLPIQYYKALLGGQADDFEIYADSVFDTRKRMLFIANDVSSKYTRRSEDEFRRMAEYIKQLVSARRGNYLVFCPSFAVQKQVVALYENEYLDSLTEKVIVQSDRMSEAEREEFLQTFQEEDDTVLTEKEIYLDDVSQLFSIEEEHFRNLNCDCNRNLDSIFLSDTKEDEFINLGGVSQKQISSLENQNDNFEIKEKIPNYKNAGYENFNVILEKVCENASESLVHDEKRQKNKIVIGFCVLGGIFSEGIDLKGDSLIGSIIIGNGLPGISIERNIMKDYFDEQGVNGFDYAYKIPGLNKVEQAAGRVIRTASDEGVIALLEERFLEGHYAIMFPKEWSDRRVTSIYNVKTMIDNFWSGLEGK